ncbi:hypothetical protein MCORR_v1c06970 [Mesoplasma corruscae]|uniref:Uncharacterized protein n=2 Tax=Mesoplasma corruscae TaxID=216874 RepID=A0A2S5REB0_9MOLU|nr:hypothetical protein MCORR_v1c06970 [Mesoplasma corruscae]
MLFVIPFFVFLILFAIYFSSHESVFKFLDILFFTLGIVFGIFSLTSFVVGIVISTIKLRKYNYADDYIDEEVKMIYEHQLKQVIKEIKNSESKK